MTAIELLTRDDLVHAAKDTTPLATEPTGNSTTFVALIGGHRYDPRALIMQALRTRGADQAGLASLPDAGTLRAKFINFRPTPTATAGGLRPRALECTT